MNRYRTLLSVLLGLVLLAQGFAVAAAPRATLADAASAEMRVGADMPCHARKADQTGQPDRSCCNARCPDMTTCALGHMAAIAVISLAVPPAARVEPSFTPVRAVTRTLASPLRPPIALHS